MIKNGIIFFIAALFLLNNIQAVAEEVLVSGQVTKLTKSKFLSALQRLDEKTRSDFLSKQRRVLKAVKNYYINEVALVKAKKSGLYDTPRVQALIDKAISDAVIQEMYKDYVEKNIARKNFENLASDYYKANPEKYKRAPEIDASHILINFKKRSKPEARTLIEKIREQLIEGEDFKALAKQYSDDPSVKKNNGRLGFFSRKMMVKAFSDTAFALRERGEISSIVETEFGFHIIRLEAIKKDSVIPFQEVKGTTVKDLKKKEIARLNQVFKEELLDSENVDINLPAIKAMVNRR